MDNTKTDNRPNKRPAQILRLVTRVRNASVWGFPFDPSIAIANFKKTSPPKDLPVWKALDQYAFNTFLELSAKCGALWWCPGIIPTPVSVRTSEDIRIPQVIFVFIRSTRPDDSFLPPPEIVEEMKAIFAAEGYTEEPGWFIQH